MLVLTRKIGEGIVIPPLKVSVVVKGVKGRRVRLEVSAPEEIPVQRDELLTCDHTQLHPRLNEMPKEDMRILLADADEVLSEQYKTHLAELGYQVTTASNGLECIDRFRNAKPQVVVLDAGLLWGRAEGVMALLEEHSEFPEVFVLVTYSEEDRSALAALRWFRVSNYLAKPLLPQELAGHVCNVLTVYTREQDR